MTKMSHSILPVSNEEFIYEMADRLVRQAEMLGVVLTIEQCPLYPLAMGHHKTIVSTRPQREIVITDVKQP